MAPDCLGIGYGLEEPVHRNPTLIGTETYVQRFHYLRAAPENPDDAIFKLAGDKALFYPNGHGCKIDEGELIVLGQDIGGTVAARDSTPRIEPFAAPSRL